MSFNAKVARKCVEKHVWPFQLAANHHLFQLHNVGMSQPKQQVNLSQAADGDSCPRKGHGSSTFTSFAAVCKS